MRFLKAIAFYGMTLLCLGGLAVGQEMVTVPANMVMYPDLIVYNGKIVTMDDTSLGLNTPIGTITQSMAVRGGKVQALGTSDQILRMAGPRTEKIDAKGRMVMPGIVDTHTHIQEHELTYWVKQHPEVTKQYWGNYAVTGKTDAEIEQGITLAVQEHVRTAAPGRWAIIEVASGGAGAGSGLAPGVAYLQSGKFPIDKLDKLAPNHPVYLRSHPAYQINTAWIKSVEKLYGHKMDLAAADITTTGQIQQSNTQYQMGLMSDDYFANRVPQLADIIEQGLAKNAAVGITTYVSRIMGLRFLDAFNILARQNRMPIRFGYTHWAALGAGYAEAANFYRRYGDYAGMGDDYMWSTGIGLGSIDSGPPRICSSMEASKAVKEREYCSAAEGRVQYDVTKVGMANYLRVTVGHSYADKGMDYYMDAVEAAMRENRGITLDYIRSRRLSSDHCGFYPRQDQLPRMAKLGMIISCAPSNLTRSYPWVTSNRYPAKYASQIAPARSAIAAGVMVTIENEAGVASGTAATYFYDAIPFLTRKTTQGAAVAPDEAVDRNTWLKMMTSWGARFALKEDRIGTLEPGKFADFLVLSKDIMTVPIEELGDAIPLMTVVGGKTIVLREEFAKELGKSAVGPQIKFDNSVRSGGGAD